MTTVIFNEVGASVLDTRFEKNPNARMGLIKIDVRSVTIRRIINFTNLILHEYMHIIKF